MQEKMFLAHETIRFISNGDVAWSLWRQKDTNGQSFCAYFLDNFRHTVVKQLLLYLFIVHIYSILHNLWKPKKILITRTYCESAKNSRSHL